VRALRPRCKGGQERGGGVPRDVIEGVEATLACVGGDLAGLKVGGCDFSPTLREGAALAACAAPALRERARKERGGPQGRQ